MTEVAFYKVGIGYETDRPGKSGSPIIGRGRTKAEALGNLILLTMENDGDDRIVDEISVVGEFDSRSEYELWIMNSIADPTLK